MKITKSVTRFAGADACGLMWMMANRVEVMMMAPVCFNFDSTMPL